jgi:hypothetical protein
MTPVWLLRSAHSRCNSALHHHRQQGPVDAAARLQQRWKERSLAQLGDLELDITGLGRQQPHAAAMAMGGPAG